MERSGLEVNSKRIPKHTQLKNHLLLQLEGGMLPAGARIPSEHELAEQYRVSRHTVRQALAELHKLGWLERVQGKGTFVLHPGTQTDAIANSDATVKTVGLITTYISDYIFPHIVRGVEAELRNHGYRLLLASTDNQKQKERESLEMMLSQPLSGLIIEPTKSAEGNVNLDCFLALKERNIPYLMINEQYRELNCPCLKLDDQLGGFMAAKHLLERGHRRIAGFFKTDDLQGVNRLKGYLDAFNEFGLSPHPAHVVTYTTEEKTRKPFAVAIRLLAEMEQRPTVMDQRPTAFVCYNDELAILLLEAVKQAELSVPDDVSIVGFDDSNLAIASGIKLTTLTHPKQELGHAAAKMLIQMMERGEEGENIIYQPKLVARESVRAFINI